MTPTHSSPTSISFPVESGRQRGLQLGAIAYMQKKPVTNEALKEALADIKVFIERQVKNLLVVEDDEAQRGIIELIGNSDVCTTRLARVQRHWQR